MTLYDLYDLYDLRTIKMVADKCPNGPKGPIGLYRLSPNGLNLFSLHPSIPYLRFTAQQKMATPLE